MAVEYRISNTTSFLMLGTALFWDLISVIPWLGGAISFIFGWGTFLLWFYFEGVDFFGTKKAAGAQDFVTKRLSAWAVGAVGEAITALFGLSGVYPGFLITVILMIRNVRKEDEQNAARKQAELRAQEEQERRMREVAPQRPRMDDMAPAY